MRQIWLEKQCLGHSNSMLSRDAIMCRLNLLDLCCAPRAELSTRVFPFYKKGYKRNGETDDLSFTDISSFLVLLIHLTCLVYEFSVVLGEVSLSIPGFQSVFLSSKSNF